MTVVLGPSGADGAALIAIQQAMDLPDGNPVAVLAVYRTQCEHEARKEERERILDQVSRALQYVGGPDIFRVDGDHWRELLASLRGEPAPSRCHGGGPS